MKQSYKHRDKRALIPTKEEAGMEQATPSVSENTTAEYPKNPVVRRGQDPELFWLNKYGADETDDKLTVDIRSLYRIEHISPELLLEKFYTKKEAKQQSLFDLFGNSLSMDEMDKVSEYYKHSDDWKNRLIQGDSLLVMTSLLEREGMAGKVQTIYIDPPYGIKYGSNWQIKLNNRDVKDGSDDALSGEPEQIKAFRDTWIDGVHSYLSYLRYRFIVAQQLLTEGGSIFVQISDENVHLVRCLLDEVFGSENFVSMISFKTTSGFESNSLARQGDYLIWYSTNAEKVKVRPLFFEQLVTVGEGNARWVLLADGTYRGVSAEEKAGTKPIPKGARLYKPDNIVSQGSANTPQPFQHKDKTYNPPSNSHWKANYPNGMNQLAEKNRLHIAKNSIQYIRFSDDFPYQRYGNLWTDTAMGSFTDDKMYIVQTNVKIIERCILMTTDPGDLVLDPTCGSGTTAYVAEQWGRRWITIDTSRIALNIAKQRMMTATFPYYHLHSDVQIDSYNKDGKIDKKISPKPIERQESDIRQGFVYKEVPHITLKSLANDEPADTETLYDQPYEDKKRLRVTGPFTVESLQSYEPVSPQVYASEDDEDLGNFKNFPNLAAEPQTTYGKSRETERDDFEKSIRERIESAGINNGRKAEHVKITGVRPLSNAVLHAEGFYGENGERKAYIHIGPKFGSVSKAAMNEAVKECRKAGDADWLIVMGFSFESDTEGGEITKKIGTFSVTKCILHNDFLQEGLIKKPNKTSASFVTIGEPDISLNDKGNGTVTVTIEGLDIYDPIADELRPRSRADIAYWMVDDDYDGSNFIVRQVFFSGSTDKSESKKWLKGLDEQAKQATKAKAEKTLRIEIDAEAFDRLYGYESHPIAKVRGKKIAVRVVSQFGEESTLVRSV
jgi:adenine-specific DNA-methyltransferase